VGELPRMLGYGFYRRVNIDADFRTVITRRTRVAFARIPRGVAAREAVVKRLLDVLAPAPQGFRRGPADVTWDLSARELTVRFVDREAVADG
jgi:hypothetical protein